MVPQPPNPTLTPTPDALPIALLPPDIASQIMSVTFINVGSTAVLIWDMWDNVCNDYRLVTEFSVQLPTLVYFISRLATVYYVLTYTIFNTALVTWSCSHFARAVSVGFPIAIIATSFLFLLRATAIFNRNRLIVIFFSGLWVMVVASSLTGPFGTSGINLGPTKYCVFDKFEDYVAAAAIVPLVFDTLVFVVVSWRLMTDALMIDQDMRTYTGLKALVLGSYLPTFSKSLLQDGQVYYLTTISTGLTSIIMLYVPGVPSFVLRTMLTVPNITLMNIMACRVFRKTKFGLFRETSISTSRIFGSMDMSTDVRHVDTVNESSPTPATVEAFSASVVVSTDKLEV